MTVLGIINALVPAGLVCLELYKVLQNKKVEDYRNTFANLAVPLFAMSEPVPPKKYTFNKPDGSAIDWSLWDRWILQGDLTVQQVLDWFKARSPCIGLSYASHSA